MSKKINYLKLLLFDNIFIFSFCFILFSFLSAANKSVHNFIKLRLDQVRSGQVRSGEVRSVILE
jgi:hypothetical protein